MECFIDRGLINDINEGLNDKIDEFIKLIVIKYNGKSFGVDELRILYDKINNNISIDEEIKEEGKEEIQERMEIVDNVEVNDKNCIAWIFKNGNYSQCTRSKLNDSTSVNGKCYCGLHVNQIKKNGKLKYGNIIDDLPIKKEVKNRGRPKKQTKDNLDYKE